MDIPKIDVQPGLFSVPMHATVRAGRPMSSYHGSVRGAGDADNDHHDNARAVLAVLHDDID